VTINKTSNQIRAYAELRKEIREALRRQHPEWVDSNGKSPLCDSYEARLAELLALVTLRKRRQSLICRDVSGWEFRSTLTIGAPSMVGMRGDTSTIPLRKTPPQWMRLPDIR
jgi:hypothetical protein